MKIVSKEIKKDGSESIVYLIDDTGRPLLAEIVNNNNKKDLINSLLGEFFIPEDWNNNPTDLVKNVEEITYEQYINQ